jgi:hypothetical protein
VAAHDLTSHRRYHTKAESIFRQMVTGWDDTFGFVGSAAGRSALRKNGRVNRRTTMR